MESGHAVSARTDTFFRHRFDADHGEMRRLYEQAKRDQWNASRDIDWARPADPEQGVVADELVDIHGTPFWDRLPAKERTELNRRIAGWRLSLLLYGEHGAMLVSGQLVESVPGNDAKFFQATQVVDEARHNEVLHRYMTERLGGLIYPIAGNVREIFDTLLGDSRWYVKTIGLQLVAETFAVSLFKMLAETSKDETLREVCRRILQDEARHMGFGMLSLPETVAQASDAERQEMEEFTYWALVRTLTGLFPQPVYAEMGFTPAEIEEIRRLRRVRAAGGEEVVFRRMFKRDLHTSLVRNLTKIGLLTPRMAPKLESLGISLASA